MLRGKIDRLYDMIEFHGSEPAGSSLDGHCSLRRYGIFGDREFEMDTTRTLTFEQLGETDFEVPAEALAKFQS